MRSRTYDVAIVGGGIVGLATGLALAGRRSVVVLEAEDAVARHQSGHNSGVIHSGLYYRPGSQKARLCVEGRKALYRFCGEHDIPHDRRGKLVVATREDELPALDELWRRGRANALRGLRRLAGEELAEFEPHAAGLAGLWVPETGIVDFRAVSRVMAEAIRRAGGEVETGARVRAVRRVPAGLAVVTARGTVTCAYLVNCAGLHSDRVARLCGARPDVRIIPFRGEYYAVRAERQNLVRGLLYPVPDPRFPFLGVHFTRTIDGGLEAGPNAVLALRREGYRRFAFSPRDAVEILLFPGFWRLARRYRRTGVLEAKRSFMKRRFVSDLRRLVPELRPDDVARAGAGVRAQAVDRQGRLVDDFRFAETQRSLHVLNAPSPAATASIAIGRHLVDRVEARR